MGKKIYLAASWRNGFQPYVLRELRAAGHEVYDFRNPAPGVNGFSWTYVENAPRDREKWSALEIINVLNSERAQQGFDLDFDAMKAADVGVMLMPSGRSAHIEAGYFVGAGKPLFIVLPLGLVCEPELMWKMGTVLTDGDSLRKALEELP